MTAAWRARVEQLAYDQAVRAQAEEAAEWFATHYPDPWEVVVARRDALDTELHPRPRTTETTVAG